MAKAIPSTLDVVEVDNATVAEVDTTPAGSITEGSNKPGTYELPNGTIITNY